MICGTNNPCASTANAHLFFRFNQDMRGRFSQQARATTCGGRFAETAEILVLRHQLAVLQRRQPRQPKLNWADRALLATMLSVILKAHRHGLRLLVTPDTIRRWHRDMVRRRWAARSMHGKTGRPATRSNT